MNFKCFISRCTCSVYICLIRNEMLTLMFYSLLDALYEGEIDTEDL